MSSRRAFLYRSVVLLSLAALVGTSLFATTALGRTSSTVDQRIAQAAAPFVPDVTKAPYTGSPISHGLGPTYGETWCAAPAPGSSIANQQGAPLALVPYEAFGCLLEQFQEEAAAAGVEPRMTFSLIGHTDAGRNQYGVVVNALETDEQVEAYDNWLAYREVALTDPHAAQDLLESYGDNVKIPVFVENNIHGDEEEGGDSMMQIIRDLTVTPRGVNATVDNFLDHAILVTIPNMNPDGRFLGTRQNANGYDMNRDWLVQSQPEVRNNIALQLQWLAPVMLATHGYVNPTLIDGLTKPHNPGLEYDIFLYWNQRRLDANQAALARIGQGITRPVNGPLPVTVDKPNYISSATSSGTTATIATTTAHGLLAGASVTVAGVAEAGYNGTVTITTVPTVTTFTYTIPAPLPPSSGGTAGTVPFTTLARGACSNGNVPAPATNVCGTGAIAASPNGLSQSGTTVTVTTNAVITAAPVKVADTVVIAGAGVAGYNGGPFRVTSVLSPTQFTYEAMISGLAPSGGGTVQVQTGPNQAEGWDDLGPFYTQTYGAFYGVDGSTLEMCSSCAAPFTGRLGSKTAQYVGFWSSADFWIQNREAMLGDQVEMFVRGADEATRPNCCDDPLVIERGFTEAEHDWMTEYPEAFIIPVHGGGQRSDAEANRMAQWILDNGITLERTVADFTWGSTTYPAGSYVIPMDQPMRGLAFTALAAGIDYSPRINQLYAPPGAWSHGLMFGADTVEVPRDDPSFTPSTEVVTAVGALHGGVAAGESDWYSLPIKGVRELQAVYDLLRAGHYGELAEAPFVSTSGGPMPAGTLIFDNDPVTVAALEAAGEAAGVTFQRNVAVVKPATTKLSEAPKIGILVNANAAGVFTNSDTSTSLKRIFGDDAIFISMTNGSGSIQNAPVDPLLGIDVLYNAGQGYPANATARGRLNAFFARGGGYIGSSQSTNNFSFLTGAAPPLVGGSFTQASVASFGGTAIWSNAGGTASPLTGAMPATDFFYLPQNVTYFSATPTGASVDGQYLSEMGSAANPRGPTAGYVAGLWLNRGSAASLASNNAPVMIHGTTTASSRYFAIATNPFSRSDFERSWGLIGQAVLWSDLTDETPLAQTITFDAVPDKTYTDDTVFTISPTASSGLTVSLAAVGDCTLDGTTSPTDVHIDGAGSCTITASQAGTANYAPAPDVQQVVTILPEDAVATYTGDTISFTAPGSTTVSAGLSATIQDSSLIAAFADSTPGDVTHATVTFMEGSTALCGPIPVTLIAAPRTTGTAACSATLGIGGHHVDVIVGGWYTGTDVALIEVLAPDGTYVAGGGETTVGASAGTYAADPESAMEFGFNIKYTKNLKNLVGHSSVIFERNGHIYEIRGTNTESLGLVLKTPGGSTCPGPPSSTCFGLGDYRSKANLLDITKPSQPVTVASNLSVQITLTDKGSPGKDDSIGVTLKNGSTLLFSSDWNGAKTVERQLTGGNIVAH